MCLEFAAVNTPVLSWYVSARYLSAKVPFYLFSKRFSACTISTPSALYRSWASLLQRTETPTDTLPRVFAGSPSDTYLRA